MKSDCVLAPKNEGSVLVEGSVHYDKCNIKGYKNIKFLLCLALGALLLSFGCKQADNGGGQGEKKIVIYKVEHLQENKDDDEYTKYETEEMIGEVGKSTNAQAKSYEGFIAQVFAQSPIKVDGSTIVQIKYKRKITSLILNLDGGEAETKLENGQDGNKILRGKYDAKVEVKGLTKRDYVCEKWEPPLPLNFPIKDDTEHIYTAKWKDSIQINIVEGDERLGVICHGDFPFRTGMTWADIKEKMAQNVYLKGEWQGGDYELYDWRCENEDGEEITDEKIIVEDGMKVYPRSNYAKFKWEEDEPTSLAGCTGGKPRGKIIIPTKTTIIKMFAFDHCRELTAVDFRGCSKLKEIGFDVFNDCEALETVNLTGCSELTKIFLGRTAITGIDLSPCPKLTEISFYGCTKLESVKLTGCSEITYVNLCSTAITSMDLSGYSKLTYIDLSSTAISSIDLSTCPKVKTIDFSSCGKLESVNLTGCSELTVVYLGCIPITSMDLSICPKLTKIDFAGCQKLESVDLTGCSKLKKIDTDTFFDCIEAIVTLGVDIKEVSREAFGSHKDDWCKRVCVPNDTIKRLVINSGYPEDRIEIY